MSSSHRSLNHIKRSMSSASNCKRCFDASGQDRDSPETYIQIRRVRKFQSADNLKLNYINVDFVKTCEEHQRVSTCRINLGGKVGEGSEQRQKLPRHRNTELTLYICHHLHHLTLDFG